MRLRNTAIVIRLHSENSMHPTGHTQIPTTGHREIKKRQHTKPPRSPKKEVPPKRKRSNTITRSGLKVYAAPRKIPPSPQRPVDFSLLINFSFFTNSSCTRNRVVKGLMWRSLNQHPLTVFTAFIGSSLIL